MPDPHVFGVPAPGEAAHGPRSQEECLRTCQADACRRVGPTYCALAGLPATADVPRGAFDARAASLAVRALVELVLGGSVGGFLLESAAVEGAGWRVRCSYFIGATRVHACFDALPGGACRALERAERASGACACPKIGAEGKRLCAALAAIDRRRHAGEVLRASEWEAVLTSACDQHDCADRESVLAFLRSCLAAHPPVGA